VLDPEQARALLKHHFTTLTREEFVANVRLFNTDLAQELWGDRSVEEICAARPTPVRRVRGLFAPLWRSVLRLFS
jgi:hypothetical protein